MFWKAAPSDQYPLGHRSGTLPPAVQPFQAHVLEARYVIVDHGEVERLTARLRMRPIGFEVLQDLIDSGDLDPEVLKRAPTFDLLGAVGDWTPEGGFVPATWTDRSTCRDDYRCAYELDPSACRKGSRAPHDAL